MRPTSPSDDRGGGMKPSRAILMQLWSGYASAAHQIAKPAVSITGRNPLKFRGRCSDNRTSSFRDATPALIAVNPASPGAPVTAPREWKRSHDAGLAKVARSST